MAALVIDELGSLHGKGFAARGMNILAAFHLTDVALSDTRNRQIKERSFTPEHSCLSRLCYGEKNSETLPIKDVTEETWDTLMAVNLKSSFFVSQQVLKYMNQVWRAYYGWEFDAVF